MYTSLSVLFLPFTYPFKYIPECKHFLSFLNVYLNSKQPLGIMKKRVYLFFTYLLFIYIHFLPLLNVSLNPKIWRIYRISPLFHSFSCKNSLSLSPCNLRFSIYFRSLFFSFATFTTLFRWYASKLSFAVLR